jgi:hypothetical protein
MKNYLGIVLLVLGFALAPQLAPAQCPMCKAAVTSGSNYGAKESKLVAGLNTGILYLFVLPYGSLMLIGVVIVVHYRKKKRAEARELSDTTVEDVIGDHQPEKRDASTEG